MSSIMAAVERFKSWLVPDDDPEVDNIDTEYLLSRPPRYKYITIINAETDRCRCDLCGSQYTLDDFEQLVEHVAAHNEQGAAEIDPFEQEAQVWGVDPESQEVEA